ncbi:hypothetical protein [Symmachiella macrocystis]|uniref:hypothetical protein n=1 Tax=Symmachiella macrocystis TaxID=2527985 RepID=UPI0018D337FC|nr:hypothetical protein [Symmachiella macrocystis]
MILRKTFDCDVLHHNDGEDMLLMVTPHGNAATFFAQARMASEVGFGAKDWQTI